jgi:mono/diheme cytochrome c family protein
MVHVLRRGVISGVLGLAVGLGSIPSVAHDPPGAAAKPAAPAGTDQHFHAPIPPAYASAHLPARVWTDPKMLARGKEIFAARCAVCHGESGDGKGPGGAALAPWPADLTDARMVAEMPGNYWFWRVSEGGLVEPFRSLGSAMPAWKHELSVADRWAVIAYAHTLSGHAGPHTAAEHPELRAGSHGSHQGPGSHDTKGPAGPAPASPERTTGHGR